ncbi:MAG: hypothetical protein AAF449_04985 [Myxococcota bacterium]
MPPPTSALSTALTVVVVFATPDADRIRLIVDLEPPAPVRVKYGDKTHTSTLAKQRHVFDDLRAPVDNLVSYRVQTAGARVEGQIAGCSVPPTFAFIGDGGPGLGPRRRLWSQFGHRTPVVLAAAPFEWKAVVQQRKLRSPSIWVGAPGAAALFPRDSIRDDLGLPKHVFHVRCGAVLLWILDASLGFAEHSPQAAFMRQTSRISAVEHRVAVLAHGPASSGRQGGHAMSDDFLHMARSLRADLVVSGQDRFYERLSIDGLPVVVTGASGAAVDHRRRWSPRSRVLVPSPNWVDFTVTSTGTFALRALGIEGAQLDQFQWTADSRSIRPNDRASPVWILLSLGVLVASLLGVAIRLLRAPGGSR